MYGRLDDDVEELALASLFRRSMLEDFCARIATFVLRRADKMCYDIPELATPYSLPACIARCALDSFVDAIIFMDYAKACVTNDKSVDIVSDSIPS